MHVIYLVPHTHYDVAWAFSREDYLRINEEILEQALYLLKTTDFKFCLEQVFLLRAIEERNPRLWQELREMIHRGKLEVVDGQYLMPDTMLPTGEVLIREIVFGKRYCREKLGIDVPVAWAVDSFGMNAQLPQIYRKSGYRWLAFRRGARAEITQSEFLWQGLDGTQILTHWMPLGYRAGLDPEGWERAFVELNRYATTPYILMPCGSGSMPPLPEVPEAVERWNREHATVQIKIATPSEFFQALEGAEKKLAVVEGELYDDELVDVFPQVCSSRIWIVRGVRECESLLLNAEIFATIAWLLGAEYPEAELRRAWEKVLYLAFHDIITGCGVDEVYDEVAGIFETLRNTLSSLLECSLRYIASKVSKDGKTLVVFNPLPWETENWVEAELGSDFEPGLCDGDEEIETQILARGEKPSFRIGFKAALPPLGYRVYRIVARRREPEPGIRRLTGEQLETPFFRLSVDPNTGIIKLYNKEGDILVSGNELVIEDEIGDLYYHRCRFTDLIKSESGEGFQYGDFRPRAFRIEEGPLKTRIIFENEYYCLTWPYRMKHKFRPKLFRYKVMDIVKEVSIFRDLPRVEFRTVVDNKYPCIRLRVKFDTGIERKFYFRETQFGVVAEPTEYYARTRGARPAGIPHFMTWFDYGNGARGITFMNRGLPASEIVKNCVYLTLFRSVYGLSADGVAGPLVPTPDALELKPHIFEYSLQPHPGTWRQAKVYRWAQEYHHLPLPVEAEGQGGELPRAFSFLELSPDNLILSALKKAEESDEVILRFFETRGEATRARISFFRPVREARLADLLEREERTLPAAGEVLEMEVKPFEIVTLKLKF